MLLDRWALVKRSSESWSSGRSSLKGWSFIVLSLVNERSGLSNISCSLWAVNDMSGELNIGTSE